jgi:uncharacterized protein YndB with AHSA1/START domain
VHTEVTVTIDAPAERAWAVLVDVERWPMWTESMNQVAIDGPLEVGAVAKIRQPRLPATAWTVTEVIPGRAFTWEAKAPGALTVARHEITPTGDFTSQVHLSLDQTGPIGSLIGRLYRGLTKRYVQMEADGLAAEAARS